jgi:hypothetical protein
MWEHFLAWLISAPSPWDLLAGVGAFGAWVVNALDRRDRQRQEEPIFEPEARRGTSGAIYVSIKIRNNYPHGLGLRRVKAIQPHGLLITTKRDDKGHFATPTEPSFIFRQDLKPGGESPSYAGRLQLAHGDTIWLKFSATYPSSPPAEITIEIETQELKAGSRKKKTRLSIEVELATPG